MIRPNKRGRVPTASEVAAAARRADHHLRARYHAQVLEAVATCATAVQLGTLRGLVEVAVPLREFAPELLRWPGFGRELQARLGDGYALGVTRVRREGWFRGEELLLTIRAPDDRPAALVLPAPRLSHAQRLSLWWRDALQRMEDP